MITVQIIKINLVTIKGERKIQKVVRTGALQYKFTKTNTYDNIQVVSKSVCFTTNNSLFLFLYEGR